MTRLFALFFLMTSLVSTGTSSSGTGSTTKPDAAALLNELKEKYAKVQHYDIEAIEEVEWRGELSRQWEKSFHDDTGEIQRQFPPGSVPEVVLIDPSKKITYAAAGFDEAALPGAIAQLGPEFASLAAKPAP